MRSYTVVVLLPLLVAGAVAPAHAEDRPPDRRTVSSKQPGDTAMRESLVDILQQLDALQREVKELRNTVEVQSHDLEQLKARQRTLYDDLDKRLRETEKRAAAAPPAPAVDGAAPATPAAAPRPPTAQQQQEYDAAFDLMKQGQYDKAIKAFRGFVAKYPDSALADNAQYWIAEGNYVLRNYKLALEEFTKVVNDAKNPKVPDALLKIGYVQYELGAYDKARKALTEVQQRFPGTTVAKLAATRLDKMKKEGH